jgi:alkyldihydroxyacetonephosphate synthase
VVPERPPTAYPNPSWWGWGDPSEVPTLPDDVRRLLEHGLGATSAAERPEAIADISVAPPRLPADAVAALSAVVGPGNALADDESRLRHTRGKSTPDLLRLRARDGAGAPDLVVVPGSHDVVLELLRICSERSVAVIPYGGGTSVVGGLEPEAARFAGVVALDVRRLNALVELDEESRLAGLEPGLRGPEAEALLQNHGYTIGHFPQSFEYATLGGFAATRSSGQTSAGYGRFDELVLALRLATPQGTLSAGRAPKSAAGPDLRQLILGSEGVLGVITSLTVAVRPVPRLRVYDGWRFASFADGIRALRALAQDGPSPTVLRLSDEAETALGLTTPSALGEDPERGGCLAIVGFEGSPADLSARVAAVKWSLEGAGAERDRDAGEAWSRARYQGPYLRDALLDAGVFVETLETVGFWSRLPKLYQAVSGALRDKLTAAGAPPVILCHISHVYPAGASLYFTVACAQRDDPLGQWQVAKRAASDAILEAGGSITHHHGVGRDHREWYAQEVGELGIQSLRALKAELDPMGILNPGVLLPPA